MGKIQNPSPYLLKKTALASRGFFSFSNFSNPSIHSSSRMGTELFQRTNRRGDKEKQNDELGDLKRRLRLGWGHHSQARPLQKKLNDQDEAVEIESPNTTTRPERIPTILIPT
ncbi:MAG: hypothetical protein K8R69_08675 [Deltaproteobacteria bacterium]|nr:hypothetical protein [Deltaproteobacteria bacterium]